MNAAEANKLLRYYRIQQLYKYLQSYQLSHEFIASTLSGHFTVGEPVIHLALRHEVIKLNYEHLDLDFKWADLLIKKVQSREYRQRKEQKRKSKTQPELFSE